ncbi:MAG: PilT/PilU family type 4a pilus ATPase [Candidatus Magasanikbacteria bacterium]|nr:PilT/PilU family type 4a pilus ATPase [Candidatus Magasanikbacteria bacterium]
MKSLSSYFQTVLKKNASDLHLIAGKKPSMRLEGKLIHLSEKKLHPKVLKKAIFSILSPSQIKKFKRTYDLDFSYSIKNGRFRINLHKSLSGLGLSARYIPNSIPSIKELRFEPYLKEATKLLDGLVLVTGPTGSGKSTTISAMIEQINKTRKAHIITIEDPIEFVFKDDKSIIEQREVGADTPSFASALKHVLRQDPNIIVVGEMRDPETIATVLTAAETGHLVFSTLHTPSAAEAVERIVDVFEGAKQKQILIQFSSVLRGVISQQLIPGKSGKRVAAREILVNTPAVSNLIRENNISQLYSSIQTGGRHKMISMRNSVKKLLKEKLITKDIAERRVGRSRKV